MRTRRITALPAVFLGCALGIHVARAQGTSSAPHCGAPAEQVAARFATLTNSARATLDTGLAGLWGAGGAVDWLGVVARDGALCALATADPKAPGYRANDARPSLWAGALAPGLTPANTSVDWAGRRWAMIILPLPDDSVAAVRLLVHEAIHTLQDTTATAVLPKPRYQEGGAGAALLDAADGRIWLRLELRALASALKARGAGRRRAARDALAFRARRYALASADERQRERALDVIEGMPEYTAWKLTAASRAPALVAAMLAARDRAMADTANSATAVRDFPYATGPAYGLLLDALVPSWRPRLRAARGDADLQALLARRLGASPAVDARVAARRYGMGTIAAEESRRWARRQRELADLRASFVDGPTIRIRPAAMRISFDPRAQVSLGDAGTVMRGFVWRGGAGEELSAPGGALVSTDWRELRIPVAGFVSDTLREGPLAAAVQWRGAGWILSLPAGWKMGRDGASWVLTPP